MTRDAAVRHYGLETRPQPMNLQYVSAEAEQAWNERVLSSAVRAPQLAIWAYREPAVVLGASQARVYASVVRDARLPIVQRRSGGGAVLVGPGFLGVSVALPLDHPLVRGGPVSSYEWFGEAHAAALNRFGVDCEALHPKVAKCSLLEPNPAEWACYGALGPWEVVSRRNRRKIVGLAQRRAQMGVLLASGVLMEDPNWDALCDALGESRDAATRLRMCSSSCDAEVGRPLSLVEVADELATQLRETLDREHGDAG